MSYLCDASLQPIVVTFPNVADYCNITSHLLKIPPRTVFEGKKNKDLTLSQASNTCVFTCLRYRLFENTVYNEEKLPRARNVLFSFKVFYSLNLKVLLQKIFIMEVFVRWLVGLGSWLVVLGFNATLTAKVISWRSVYM